MKCNAPFDHDPSYQTLKCELPKGHKCWHEYGLTTWAADEHMEVISTAQQKRAILGAS